MRLKSFNLKFEESEYFWVAFYSQTPWARRAMFCPWAPSRGTRLIRGQG